MVLILIPESKIVSTRSIDKQVGNYYTESPFKGLVIMLAGYR